MSDRTLLHAGRMVPGTRQSKGCAVGATSMPPRSGFAVAMRASSRTSRRWRCWSSPRLKATDSAQSCGSYRLPPRVGVTPALVVNAQRWWTARHSTGLTRAVSGVVDNLRDCCVGDLGSATCVRLETCGPEIRSVRSRGSGRAGRRVLRRAARTRGGPGHASKGAKRCPIVMGAPWRRHAATGDR